MAHKLIGSFDSHHAAEQVVRELAERGFKRDEISILMSSQRKQSDFLAEEESRVPPPDELNAIVERMEAFKSGKRESGPRLETAGPMFIELSGMNVRPAVIYPDPQPDLPPESGHPADPAPNETPVHNLAEDKIVIGVEVPQGPESDRIRDLFHKAGGNVWEEV